MDRLWRDEINSGPDPVPFAASTNPRSSVPVLSAAFFVLPYGACVVDLIHTDLRIL